MHYSITWSGLHGTRQLLYTRLGGRHTRDHDRTPTISKLCSPGARSIAKKKERISHCTSGEDVDLDVPECSVCIRKFGERGSLPIKSVEINVVTPPGLNVMQAYGPISWVLEAEEYKHGGYS